MKIAAGILWGLGLAMAGHEIHAAEACVGLDKIAAEVRAKAAPASVKEAARKIAAAPPPAGIECSSLRTVLRELVSGRKNGGRQLEDDKPLDEEAAKKNLKQALAAPEVQQVFAKLQSAVSDKDLRQLYEAAVLDAEGFYSARDLAVTKAMASAGSAP